MAVEERIVLRYVGRPPSTDMKELTDWFIKVFDLGGKEDGLEPSIFKEIIANNTGGNGVTSKALTKKLDVPRSTVIYHLNRLIYSGLVVRKSTRYYLRSEDMHGTIEELHADMEREFSRMMQFADMMDKMFEDSIYARRKQKR